MSPVVSFYALKRYPNLTKLWQTGGTSQVGTRTN
ncbi:hypothetical protein CHELA20_54125 [Hyphomicrobiales bacterium]|nr:hypothetical protein CHELA41_20802 [Hyphomicrobiales bacterium]CAH1685638.1 hypothetical protein CHELA20_54125 [Hyphomicrobiales bacterium]